MFKLFARVIPTTTTNITAITATTTRASSSATVRTLKTATQAGPSTSARNARITARDRCQCLSTETEGVRIVWGDGHESYFHSIWLRDHNPSDFHPTSGQRQLDTTSIPETIAPQRLNVSQCGTNLDILWNDMQRSIFPLSWLRKNCYSLSERKRRAAHDTIKPIAWDASKFYGLVDPPFEFDAVVQDDNVLHDAIKHLLVNGALVFSKIPSTAAATKAVADRIGAIRNTFYGDVWDTKPKEKVNDTAYTNIELKPHTDATYFSDPPALQFFNCIEQSATGGKTWLVDGFRIADRMRTEHPDAFQFFSTRKIPFIHSSRFDGAHMLAEGHVFELDNHGAIVKFRYNNDDRSVLNSLSSEDVPLFYKYLRILTKITRDQTMGGFIQLQAGSALLVHNHRVLHGRKAFVGSRNLQGWYMGHDELASCARRLGLSF